MEQVTADIKDAHDVVVTSTANSISLWVTASPKYLYYIYGRKSDTTDGHVQWNPPFKFATNVRCVSAIRNAITDSNEVFTTDQDNSISHYWQDPKSTNWYSKKVSFQGKPSIADQKSYISKTGVKSCGVPLADFEFKITSSEWQYCQINGIMYSLDVDTPAYVTTDALGNVTIVGPANDISPPLLHLQSDSFSETINIYPNGKLQHYLQKVKNGNDLRAARTQDDKPILDSSITTELSDRVARNIRSLIDLIGDQFPPIASSSIFVSIEGAAADAEMDGCQAKHTFDRKLDTSHIPDGPLICMSTTKGKWVNKADEAASFHIENVLAQGLIDDLSDFSGDVWYFLENFATADISYIEKGAVSLKDDVSFMIQKTQEDFIFIFTIAGKGFSIILDTVGKVLKVVSWVLLLVGVDFNKVIESLPSLCVIRELTLRFRTFRYYPGLGIWDKFVVAH
ncbi:hypothetical protein ABW20_dc0108395 [Dactylellina cionopaga]|nr:hypothetical protein ABW20_dc0108395 [Dactylellina cionopaga]